jgi:hypothetical protein
LGVEGKQLRHLHQNPRRDQILFVELQRLVELSPGMSLIWSSR